MKPFGSWFNESAQAVSAETKTESKDFGSVADLIVALEEIADTDLPCGCVPCRGQCWGKDELQDLVYALRDSARIALNNYRGQ